jgi:hypothetical protein
MCSSKKQVEANVFFCWQTSLIPSLVRLHCIQSKISRASGHLGTVTCFSSYEGLYAALSRQRIISI